MDNKIIMLTISCVIVIAIFATSFFLRTSTQEKLFGNDSTPISSASDPKNSSEEDSEHRVLAECINGCLVEPTETDWQGLGTEFSTESLTARFMRYYSELDEEKYRYENIKFWRVVPHIMDFDTHFYTDHFQTEKKTGSEYIVFDEENVKWISENIFNIIPDVSVTHFAENGNDEDKDDDSDEADADDSDSKREFSHGEDPKYSNGKYYVKRSDEPMIKTEYCIADYNNLNHENGLYTVTVMRDRNGKQEAYREMKVGLKKIDSKLYWSLYEIKPIGGIG